MNVSILLGYAETKSRRPESFRISEHPPFAARALSQRAPILDAAEEILILVPSLVNALGTIDFFGSVAAIGNDRQGPFILDLLAPSGCCKPCPR